ncbi:MAG: putative FAD-linked oxidoreductase [Alphaproteobacteria bacterium MarineAlpha10_Bin3]|nr:MAG: putative FAD-linked oxidoreductase [Alphaproteobacteria bacterium MarineAlpha10_Bin3]PPR68778.1 MAG: putative FAD-linked oxidoreductase [Alphaproteobacteria bacterium MarineAlpha4_Bin1]
MTTTLKPENAGQVRDAIAWAVAQETPLEVLGGGSKRAIGRPGNAGHTLDLSALRGITLYEAEELVLSAGPGTPIAEIDAALGEFNQELAFEPPDYGPLLGQAAGAGTLGGVIAANLAGPRRIKAGAARDHFLGFAAVSGRGEAFKSGGRVVKNVTGYDLCKVLAGSWGTLGAMTQVTVKVLPAAPKLRTVLILGCDGHQATAAMTGALQSPYEVSGAAFLPAASAARSGVDYVCRAAASVIAIRIEGPDQSVEYRCAALRAALAEFGPTEELHGHNSAAFWREVRDVLPFAGDTRIVWKISVPPSDGARVADSLDGDAFLDWGGGLIWLAVDAADGAHQAVRAAIAGCGGHATLIRAPAELRAAIAVFQPEEPGLARLSAGLKASFDPRGVLNPGRIYAGV